MKQIITLFLFFIINISFAQSNFYNGFESGFKNGYCHNQGISCISPVPPNSPIPKVNENINSYQDGYNRGFEMGLNSNKSRSTSTENSRQRYQTSSSTFVENKMSNINYNDVLAIAGVLRQAKEKALELFNDEKYEESVEICKAGLKINPKDDEFMMFIGDIDSRFLNNDGEALYYLEKAYRINRMENVKNKIDRIRNGTEERVKISGNLVTPENVMTKEQEIINLEIEISQYFKAANYLKVLELASKYSLMKPGIIANTYLGYANYYLKDYTNAVKYFSLALIAKQVPDIFFIRSISKSELNDKLGAIWDLDKLIELGESKGQYDMATVYNNKAYALVGLKKYKEALPLVKKALSLNSNIWYIWDTSGEINYNLKLYKECISDMEKAISLNPDGNSYYYCGLSKVKLMQSKNACKDFSKAGELGKKEAYQAINQYCK
jgi:tetratricopeptide (TPR) repeat protein